jgi:hypothetical protein
MPGLPLSNLRWEKFCQAFVHGPTAGNAAASYAAAGFAGAGTPTAKSGAFRLLQSPVIRGRVAELQAEAAAATDRVVICATEQVAQVQEFVLTHLRNMGSANVLDYVHRDETGAFVVDLARIERDKAAGIAEINITQRGEGAGRVSNVRIKLCDRVAPLVHLGRHYGLFNERKHNVHEHLAHLTDDDLWQRAAELERELALGNPAQPGHAPGGAQAPPQPQQAEPLQPLPETADLPHGRGDPS